MFVLVVSYQSLFLYYYLWITEYWGGQSGGIVRGVAEWGHFFIVFHGFSLFCIVSIGTSLERRKRKRKE